MTAARLLGGAMVIVALVISAGANAASGTVGTYEGIQATCWGDSIVVSAPHIEPSEGSGSGFVVGPARVQWVAFRANLALWDPAKGWVVAATGPWKAMKAASGVVLGQDEWFNLQTRKWEGGGTAFTIRGSGTFRAYADYYWYADDKSAAGSDSAWATYTYDYRSGGLGAVDWCTY